MTILLAFGLLVRAVVGGLLLVAGAAKVAAGQTFRIRSLEAYGIFPRGLLPIVSVGLAGVELAVGASFLLGVGGAVGALAAGVVVFGVTLGAGTSLLQGRTPDCGCLGTLSSQLVSWRLIVRNLGFLVAIAIVGAFDATGPGVAGLPWPLAATAAAVLMLGSVLAIDGVTRHQGRLAHATATT
jgi:hypothetical protein